MEKSFRVLLLGAGGFVGGYLRLALEEQFGCNARVLATSLHGNEEALKSLDVTDIEKFSSILEHFRPTHIVNLAGLAAPSGSRADLQTAWLLHAQVPYLLGRAILKIAPECWFLHVGSGLVYGGTALSTQKLAEDSLLAPTDPYSVTKAAGDLALGALAGEGLRCLRLRPFNHTGPAQNKDFAVPAFAAQLAEIAMDRAEPFLHVGNLDAERDFLDVRDVARAYTELILRSDSLISGDVYNVCSGRAVGMESIVEALIRLSGVSVTIVRDPARQRASDVPRMCGSPLKLHSSTSWRPTYSLEQTLTDTFNYQLVVCGSSQT